MTSNLTSRAMMALAGLSLCATALGADSPSGKVIHASGPRADASAFDSAAPVHIEQKPEPVQLFDQSKLPSSYKTPWVEYRISKHLKIMRPYDGAVFPANVCAPLLKWEDETDDLWLVSLKAPGWAEPLRVVTDRTEWRPDSATWDAVKKAGEGAIELELRGIRYEDGARVGTEVYTDRIAFTISKVETDPLIVYRSVSPLFHALKTPDINYRDVSTFEQKTFLPGNRQYCTNCHSFPLDNTIPDEKMNFSIAVRRNVGTKQYRILGLYNFAEKTGKTLNINSFFMSWHPSGTKVAVTGGDSVAVRPLITLETQEFYVKVADILIVDYDTLQVKALPGASTPQYMETLPTWSPDGETIVFARATEMGRIFVEKQFNLFRIPYNGGKGGEPVPLKGASRNNLSNYAPRFSPDGKWLCINQAEYASLVAPTSDLYLIDTSKDEWSEPLKLDCNVPEAGDSHHSWSSNSRWMLFASKRDDGIFARIYLTEIDDQGRASPPVELPSLGDTMLCYNVPEFLRARLPIDAMDIYNKTGSLEGVDAPSGVAGGPGGRK